MQRRLALLALWSIAPASAFALYDAAPDAALAGAQGEWRGTLTYRDYSAPDRLVTLPTRLFVALGSPDALVLHYVFDDGPTKTVHSYERMQFDFSARELVWNSGAGDKPAERHRITDHTGDGSTKRLAFERADGTTVDRHVLLLSPQEIRLSKEERGPSGDTTFRNAYAFTRARA